MESLSSKEFFCSWESWLERSALLKAFSPSACDHCYVITLEDSLGTSTSVKSLIILWQHVTGYEVWSKNTVSVYIKKIITIKGTLPLIALKMLPVALDILIPACLPLSGVVLKVLFCVFSCPVLIPLMSWICSKPFVLLVIVTLGKGQTSHRAISGE